jgi:hypothetical protein
VGRFRSLSQSKITTTSEPLLASVELDPGTQRHATVVYEIAKTRSVLLRLLDTQMSEQQVDKLVELAEGDATGYVEERLGKERGTG